MAISKEVDEKPNRLCIPRWLDLLMKSWLFLKCFFSEVSGSYDDKNLMFMIFQPLRVEHIPLLKVPRAGCCNLFPDACRVVGLKKKKQTKQLILPMIMLPIIHRQVRSQKKYC